jgi:hypothetical protein
MKEKEGLLKLRINANKTFVLSMQHSLDALKGCWLVSRNWDYARHPVKTHATG